MNRLSELFAISAIAALVAGVLTRHVSALQTLSFDVAIRDAFYVMPLQTPLYGLAALLGIFAFVYSVWMLPMNHTAAMWHCWLTIAGILLFCCGFAGLANNSGTAFRGAAIFGILVAYAVFFAGQAVFLVNFIYSVARAVRRQ